MIPTTDSTHLRILVADDYETTAESLAKLLRLWGHEVRTVTTGSEAIEAAKNFHPQVILLDILMPNLNGYEVAKQIREQRWGKSVFLVALTGLGREEDRQRSGEAGFNMHLLKPAWPADVKALIGAFMNTARKLNISGGRTGNRKPSGLRPA